MKIQFKRTLMRDGQGVFDVNILANSDPKFGNKAIFTCTTERAANDFLKELTILIERHTVERVEIV